MGWFPALGKQPAKLFTQPEGPRGVLREGGTGSGVRPRPSLQGRTCVVLPRAWQNPLARFSPR